MFVLPVAHLILLGIVKDFWDWWLRDLKDTHREPEELADLVIPKIVRDHMHLHASALKLTQEYTKTARVPDAIRCALPDQPAVPPCVLCEPCMYVQVLWPDHVHTCQIQ